MRFLILPLFLAGCSAHGALLRDPSRSAPAQAPGAGPRLTLTVEGTDLATSGLYFAPNILPALVPPLATQPGGTNRQRWVPPELLPPSSEPMAASLAAPIDPEILEWWESLVSCAAAGDERCLRVLAALEVKR